MLALDLEASAPSDAWLPELKHDGYRLMLNRHGERLRVFTRSGNDWKKRYPLIEAALMSLKVASVVWPAPGSEDTELGVLMELEVGHGEAEVHA